MDQADPVIRIEEVELAFGGVRALNGATAEIPRGGVTALVGPNGAGKTSLLNVLSGVYRREARGRVLLEGTDVLGDSAVRMRRRGVARSFQHPPFLEKESVVDNLLLGRHPDIGYGVHDQVLRPWRAARRERRERERMAELLSGVGLEEWADRPAGELPYGARKVVDVLRATSSEPSVLLLDEPTSGLDSAEQAGFLSLLQRLAGPSGPTVVLVEHHMDVVRRTARHVLGMHMGEVLMSGSPAEVLDSPVFLDAVLGAASRRASAAGRVS